MKKSSLLRLALMMEMLGYIASLLIGVFLGLLGGGGSILTVPVLVYIFNIPAVLATSYSLFIVGVTSLAGTLPYFRSKNVDIKTSVIFGIPSIAAVYVTRSFIMPLIPDPLFHLQNFFLTKNMFLMLLFSVLMLMASLSMIRKQKNTPAFAEVKIPRYLLIFLEGSVVGMLTGLVGAGGGFLIIPALVLLCKLPMKTAVGTSLVIIAFKSLIGFTGEKGISEFNWTFILSVTAASLFGMVLGYYISRKTDGTKLKPAFGWFTLVMGLFILIKEIFVK